MSPAPIHRVNRKDLEKVLNRIVSRRFGKHIRVKAWRRRVSAYSSSCIITWIRLHLDGNLPDLQLAFKDLTPGRQLPTALRVRPHFLYDPCREVALYENILNRLSLGTARYLGAEIAPEMPRYWLFLEWVKGPLLWQLGRITHWQQTARWLARFHREASCLLDSTRLLRRVRLLRYDEQSYATWIVRAESMLRGTLLSNDRSSAQQFARIVRRYDRVVDHLCQLPQTLVHGEFYPGNIVMRWTGETHETCPIDWELAGWAPGVVDLAALSGGHWSQSDKREILAAYLDASSQLSPTETTPAELARSVAYAQLHLCVRHLGWAARWRPQGQQARTWLADALTLAAQLGL